jgi:hypothetical protein
MQNVNHSATLGSEENPVVEELLPLAIFVDNPSMKKTFMLK